MFFNMIELFLWCINLAIVDFGNMDFEYFEWYEVTAIPVSILYVIPASFWLVLKYNVKITGVTLSKFRYLIFTESKFLKLSLCSLV